MDSKRVAFSELCQAILSRPCRHPVRLIGIDGGAGSGKSTFARHLSSALGEANLIPIDDFLAWDDLVEFWPRLEQEVLTPLLQGRPFGYRQRDWENDVFGRGLSGFRELPFRELALLEGVGACRRAVNERLHYRIWVNAPDDVRLRRGLLRDAELPQSHALWERWMRMEQDFVDSDSAKERADIVVDGTAGNDPETFAVLQRKANAL